MILRSTLGSKTASTNNSTDGAGAASTSSPSAVVGPEIPAADSVGSTSANVGQTGSRRSRRRRAPVPTTDDSLPTKASSAASQGQQTMDTQATSESQDSTTVTSPRRRGRPSRRSSERICPSTGDIVDDVINSGTGNPIDFSLTVSSRNSGNIPPSIFNDVAHFLEKRAVRGVVSQERGAERGNLHLQGVLTLGMVKNYDDDRKINADVRNAIKTFESWTPELRLKIDVKPLGAKQSFGGEFLRCYCFFSHNA